jgi:diaminohydroxyphosphoribosylaminopyrimidine deaminase/5-amino-6-(5-phosphoribosylamino)uracil reductase
MHRAFMQRALDLAARARGRTAPNPMVGVVIVKQGRIIGEGYHRRAGLPHAEVEALRACVEDPAGAEIYVTLEPCCHHGRTPPCVEALIRAGIARVIAAVGDPNPRVDGQGFAALRAAGIAVDVGCEAAAARRLNEAYFKAVRTGLPFLVVKAAASLDGKLATSEGHARWITGPEARAWVHRRRNETDALLVGVGTILADDPLLTTRLDDPEARSPTTVILDTHLRTPPTARTLDPALDKRVLVYCGPGVDPERRRDLEARGATVIEAPLDAHGRVDVGHVARSLVEHCLLHVTSEGGAEVNASLFAAGIVDRVDLFLAPRVIGGRDAPTVCDGEGVGRVDQAPRLRFRSVRWLGEDLLVEADVLREAGATGRPEQARDVTASWCRDEPLSAPPAGGAAVGEPCSPD